MIIKKLWSLMPHKCGGCSKIVTNSSEAKEVKCARCNTAMCANCNSGKTCVCDRCLVWIKDKYSVPEEFYKKKYKKKDTKEEEAPKKTREELFDETETGFTQRNFPPNQNCRKEKNDEEEAEETATGDDLEDVLESTRVSENMDATEVESFITVTSKKEKRKKSRDKKRMRKRKGKPERKHYVRTNKGEIVVMV